MSEIRHADLGPWAGDDFEKTVRTTPAVGVDSGLPDDVRFIGRVAKLVRKRIAQAGEEADPPRPAVFLLEPKARTHRSDIAPKRVPMLDNGLTALSGRLWFVSPVVVVGSYFELEDYDDDEVFHIVTDDLQLGDVPTVIFDPRTDVCEIRFYRNGLGDPETCEVSSISGIDVSLPGICEIIDRIHKKCLVTPDAQDQAGRLWEDNRRWLPVNNAEHVVQLYLRVGLTTALPICTIRTEQHDVPGRLDLEIEESDPVNRSNFKRHAILELKALRSFWSTGTAVPEEHTLDWVKSGVKQAASYRDERSALAAALCCFDMRRANTGNKCFDHVLDLAAEHQVLLKVWFIYATAEQYRDAMIYSTEP